MGIMLVTIVLFVATTSVSVQGAALPPDAPPVTIDLFYEALCPSCKWFIRYQLIPTWEKLKDTGILKINLHAYGNARMYQQGGRYVFQCQHGVTECQLNLYSTCAYNKLQDDDMKMRFLKCVETNPYTTWVRWCLQSIGANPDPIMQCYGNGEGNRLQKKVADIQNQLSPRLRYVPWVLVDGDSSQQETVKKDTLRYVCDRYTGTKPDACNQ